MHDRRVEFDVALFIRQSAVADRVIARIILDDVDAGDDGIERIAAGFEDFHSAGDAQFAALEGRTVRPRAAAVPSL
ncbi:hypothetical protein D3C83_247470 [compost metagenome]